MRDSVPWEGQCLAAAARFGRECRELTKTNPHDVVALDDLINTLMTELWDNNFSQSEIRSAFEQALQDMPRYAAGLERRSDGKY
jgi:hypothetical protein